MASPLASAGRKKRCPVMTRAVVSPLERSMRTSPSSTFATHMPFGSPISQSGLLFYNTLFDENAASHVALGSAYRFTLEGGEGMTNEEFQQAGGNRSAVHTDFMIGSGELDIDGVFADGRSEPLMRRGEFTSET